MEIQDDLIKSMFLETERDFADDFPLAVAKKIRYRKRRYRVGMTTLGVASFFLLLTVFSGGVAGFTIDAATQVYEWSSQGWFFTERLISSQ